VQRAQPKSSGYFGFIVRVSHGCFPDLGLRTDRKDELALMTIQLSQFAAFGSSEPLVAGTGSTEVQPIIVHASPKKLRITETRSTYCASNDGP
jgi:hypothetical protein